MKPVSMSFPCLCKVCTFVAYMLYNVLVLYILTHFMYLVKRIRMKIKLLYK